MNEAPIWVKLPSLHIEFQGEEIFAGIATCFGELILVDPMTTAKRCLVYAILCVNVKHSSNMPSKIDLFSKMDRWVQKVDYESTPLMSKPKKEWRKRNDMPLLDKMNPLPSNLPDMPLLDKMDPLPSDPPLEGVNPSIPSLIMGDGVILDLIPSLFEENIGESPAIIAPYGEETSINAIGSIQDIPIHLIIYMDNSAKEKPLISPILESSQEDSGPFIEIKPKTQEGTPLLAKILQSLGWFYP